jgi:acyl carrier protein phosphodiesterase
VGVNFFGHAAVATWTDERGATVLGAMLPDFATMCRSRLDTSTDPEIARGIELHHATDAAFHRLPPVLGLMRELDERLAAGGCARGPRRAVSHIGVELLLDGVLVEDAGYRAGYLAGLAHDPAAVRWRDADATDRFAHLLARLRAHGVPDDLRRTDAITARLSRMLAHRPLLAPSSTDLTAIARALAAHAPRVEVAADTMLRSLRAALAR